MAVIVILTYIGCVVIKKISVTIASKFLWKVPNLHILYKRGIDGNIIKSRTEYIMDAILQQEIKKLKDSKNLESISVSTLVDEVLEILKNGSSSNLVLIKLFRVFSDLDLANKLDLNKVFENISKAADAYSDNFLNEMFSGSISP